MSLSRGRQLLSLVKKIPKNYLNYPRSRLISTNVSFLCNKSVASFEDVKTVGNNPKILLIDVREPHELQETGVIPCSINIPLGEVETVLRDMSSEEFEKRYCRSKPDCDTPIIFSCRSGKRSANAQEIATKLGFKNIRNYSGGWLEWEEKNKCN